MGRKGMVNDTWKAKTPQWQEAKGWVAAVPVLETHRKAVGIAWSWMRDEHVGSETPPYVSSPWRWDSIPCVFDASPGRE